MDKRLSDMLEEPVGSPDDLFGIFESLDCVAEFSPFTPLDQRNSKEGEELGTTGATSRLASQKSSSSSALQDYSETEFELSPNSKRLKLAAPACSEDGQQRVSHIAVERNRRKQMNEHLSVLRSLMPCFYVKRGDQASIIGGVVDYINELQQILQSLEAKKQRKVYNEVLSPRAVVASSPRPSQVLSPRKPPLSPRLNLPISPTTPQPSSPYNNKTRLHQAGYISPTKLTTTSSLEPSPSSSSSNNSSSIADNIYVNELVANSKSAVAQVEVKFSGPNVLLKTVSPRIPGQAMKIIAALEHHSLEILHVDISTVEQTMLVSSFTIKIGIECQLSADELAQQIQQTFC